jgi:hypothetical protein
MDISQPEELNTINSNAIEEHEIARRQQQWVFLILPDYS